ncbi:MAG: nucleotidyltransferase domain-containing protein [Infirmifilum sp.]
MSLVEPLVPIITEMLGEDVKGVVLYGSSTVPADHSPLSDINIAVLLRKKPSIENMASLTDRLGPDVSVLFLTIDELKRLREEGEFIAHEIIRGGRILYADEEATRELAKTPPITERTKSYLRRHSTACLGLCLENYFNGRFSLSLNYAFKSLRSACRLLAVEDSLVILSDGEMLGYLEKKGMQDIIAVYRELRDRRFKGVRKGELLSVLNVALKSSMKILGFEPLEINQVIETIEKEFRFVSDVKFRLENGSPTLHVTGLNNKGSNHEILISLRK